MKKEDTERKGRRSEVTERSGAPSSAGFRAQGVASSDLSRHSGCATAEAQRRMGLGFGEAGPTCASGLRAKLALKELAVLPYMGGNDINDVVGSDTVSRHGSTDVLA